MLIAAFESLRLSSAGHNIQRPENRRRRGVRVKICGITSPADARVAVEVGADALGLNFVGGPRRIDLRTAGEILEVLPPFVRPVALVRLSGGCALPELGDWLAARRPVLQVYGDFAASDLLRLREEGFTILPVLRVAEADFAGQLREWFPPGRWRGPAGVVLDAFRPEQEGGTGTVFPWEWVSTARQEGALAGLPPIVLAGGLRPENVAEAIRIVRPYAVDVSSGVEFDGQAGRKDPQRMRAFVAAAKSA